MADALYDKAREAFLSQSPTLDWDTDTIKAVLVDTANYTFSQAHQYLSDVPAPARVATSGALASKTVTSGVADAADVTIAAVSGATVEAIILYKDTGVATTSPLISYLDSYTGLPLTPNGGDVTIAWPNDANKIFKL